MYIASAMKKRTLVQDHLFQITAMDLQRIGFSAICSLFLLMIGFCKGFSQTERDILMRYNRFSSISLVLEDVGSIPIAEMDSLIRIYPDSIFLYVDRALIKRERRDFSGAVADFDEAVKRSSKERLPSLYYMRGNTHSGRGDYAAAAWDFEELITIDSLQEDGYVRFMFSRVDPTRYMLGICKMNLGDFKGASYVLERQVQECNYDSLVYYRTKLDSGLLPLHDGLIRKYGNIHLLLGICRREEGDLPGACDAFRRAQATGIEDALILLDRYCQ